MTILGHEKQTNTHTRPGLGLGLHGTSVQLNVLQVCILSVEVKL